MSATAPPSTPPEEQEVSATWRVGQGVPSGEDVMCPDEDTILAFLERRLSGPGATTLEVHLDACPRCRRVVATLADELAGELDTPTPAEPRAEASVGLLWPGDRVGDLEVEALIGRGGMGDVYAARDTTLGRRVALKLINEALAHDAEARARILVEARAMARLGHPHIATLYSAGEHAGRPYLVLELLEGETLRQRLERGPLPLPELLEVGRAIAEALAAAHQQQVLHRDLKPQNVVLARDGRVRVLDFGLAKLRPLATTPTRPGAEPSLFETGEPGIRGTPAYLAPEQWRGEPAGEPADVWALGVVLYELLSGRRPYTESAALGYAVRVADAQPVPPPAAPPGTPEALLALIERCLAKDPTARPAAQEVSRVLTELAGAEPLRIAARLVRAASEWSQHGEAAMALWDGAELTRAEHVLAQHEVALPAAASRFLTASAERARQRALARARRRTSIAALTTTTAAAAVLLAGVSLRQAERAAVGERAAARAESEALLESAVAARAAGHTHEARAKVRAVLERGDDVRARALWTELEHSPQLWTRALGSGVFDVAVSPGGELLAVGAQDHTVYLLDARTLALRSLRGHTDQVYHLAFSRDGRRLASASWSGELRLWSVAAGTSRVLQASGPRAQALLFAPDDRALYVAERERPIRAIPLDGAAPWVVGGVGSRDLALDAKGALWSAERDGMLRRFDAQRGVEQAALRVAEVPLTAVAAAAEELAVGAEDGALRVLAPDGRLRATLRGHSGKLVRVARAGQGWVSIAEDKSARLWLPGGESRELGDRGGALWGLALDPAGSVAYVAGVDGRVTAWSLARAAAQVAPSEGHVDGATAVVFGDGVLYSGGYDHQVRRWDPATGALRGVLSGHTGTVYGLAWRDGRLASASHDGTVRLWTGKDAAASQVLSGHTGGVYAVAFAPRGDVLASAGSDRTVRLWPLGGRGTPRVLSAHEGTVFALAWSPDGRELASAGADRVIVVHGVDGRELRRLRGHEASVWGLAYAPDGRSLVSSSYDQTVRVWPLTGARGTESAGRVLARLPARSYALAFTPDGTRVIAACADGRAYSITLADGRLTPLVGHRAEVNQVRVSDDGAYAATASDDGTVRAWDLATHTPLWRAYADARQVSERGDWQCRTTWTGELIASAGGARVYGAALGEPTALVALDQGCVVIDGGVARLYGPDGTARELAAEATALAVDAAGRAWVATREQLLGFDNRGERFHARAVDRGLTAMVPLGEAWVLGFDNGRITVTGTPTLELEDTPRGRVERLLLTPERTLWAGWSSGELGLWSLDRGTRLLSARLHGPIVSLDASGGRLSAVSELGARLEPRPVFAQDHCALLRDVWSHVPVSWKDGQPSSAGPPEGHPCAPR
jgi:WD40 repeat protein